MKPLRRIRPGLVFAGIAVGVSASLGVGWALSVLIFGLALPARSP